MNMPGTVARPPLVPTVAQGGTGATTPEQARDNLDVPSLSGDNAWTGAQTFGGAVNVADEKLTLTGTGGQIETSASIVIHDTLANTVTFGDPDLMSLTASRSLTPPDETGLVAVFPTTGRAAGDMIYWDGTRPVRIPKGNDGDVLKLASGVPTWSAP